MEIRVRNVNGALARALELFRVPGIPSREVRGSLTIEWPEPVMTIYQRPQERVLLCPERDANPFFHLFEALWMLAGRNDAAFVTHMVARMASFSDDGVRMQGGYGYRWRRQFGRDQLTTLVTLLKKDPNTRRAVVAMWDPLTDFMEAHGGAQPGTSRGLASADIPCNTHLYFKIRDGALDMTVCCRSNDVVWGAYGANAVHFSILQEYVANKLEVPVGWMRQMSDSLHVYVEKGSTEAWKKLQGASIVDPYAGGLEFTNLGAGSDAWDQDLFMFFRQFDNDMRKSLPRAREYSTVWWRNVAIPLWRAWVKRDIHELKDCEAEDWNEAGLEWIQRHPKVMK